MWIIYSTSKRDQGTGRATSTMPTWETGMVYAASLLFNMFALTNHDIEYRDSFQTRTCTKLKLEIIQNFPSTDMHIFSEWFERRGTVYTVIPLVFYWTHFISANRYNESMKYMFQVYYVHQRTGWGPGKKICQEEYMHNCETILL